MHYAIVFPQRKRDPARRNEDRADDVTALQRGAHKGFYCFEWEKLWHPDIADPEIAIADYARVVGQCWETPVRAAWTGKQNTAYP